MTLSSVNAGADGSRLCGVGGVVAESPLVPPHDDGLDLTMADLSLCPALSQTAVEHTRQPAARAWC